MLKDRFPPDSAGGSAQGEWRLRGNPCRQSP